METYFEAVLKRIGCILFVVMLAMYIFGIGDSEAESAAGSVSSFPDIHISDSVLPR